MRLFFALEPDTEVVLDIADWRDTRLCCSGRPVPPANFHITLAFIGELPAAALEGLCQAVDDWLQRAAPVGGTLQLDSTGYWRKPGIYWLGPAHWPDSLSTLADKLRSLSVSAGARRDRNRFQPHITLFRSLSAPPPAAPHIPGFSMRYGHFTLFESRQGRRGVSYHALASWELRHAAN